MESGSFALICYGHFVMCKLTPSAQQAFGDIKNYYNDITLNNLALIDSLQEQLQVGAPGTSGRVRGWKALMVSGPWLMDADLL